MLTRLWAVAALVFMALAVGSTGIASGASRDQATTTPGPRAVVWLPMTGSDSASKFAIGAPGNAGTTCTRLATFRAGQGWVAFGAAPESLSFESGERSERAWRFAVALTAVPGSDLAPVRAWLHLRSAHRNGERQVVSRPGGVVPVPAGEGSWVVDELVREPFDAPETMEVQLCVEWSSRPSLGLALDGSGGFAATALNTAASIVATWKPSAGAALAGAATAVQLEGGDGLARVAGGALNIRSPLVPAGSLSLQAFAAELPATATVRTNAIVPGTAPGRTSVTFELISPAGGFEPTVRCQSPAGTQQVTLPYRVLPGVPLPFVLHFSSPSLPPNADTADFACEQVSIRGALGTPAEGQVIVSVEDVYYDRESRQYEVLCSVFNPLATPVSLAGWSLATALYAGERIAGMQEEGVDSITLAPGEYRRVLVRQPAALVGFDPAAIDTAFRTPEGMGTLRVVAGLFRRIEVR